MIHKCPDGYAPLSFCTECGDDFSGDNMFDKHRIGVHAYTITEGLRLDPPVEDGRRCQTSDEMLARGWQSFTDAEMSQSRRDRHRAGYGVQLWYDPAERERLARDKERGLFNKGG